MSRASESIQVHIEKGVLNSAGTTPVDYEFIHGSGKLIAVKPAPKKKAGDVTVTRFTKRQDLRQAIRRVRLFKKRNQPLVMVTSPAIFNEPAFRDAIQGGGIEVLVDGSKMLAVSRLAPWIDRVARTIREAPAPVDSAADPMGVSTRLRDPASGRLDALKVAGLLGIVPARLARLCGVSRQNLGQSPTSAGIQAALQPLENVAEGLSWCGGDEGKFRAWLNRPNPDFPKVHGKTLSPMDLILQGHAPIVARKVANLRTGHPA